MIALMRSPSAVRTERTLGPNKQHSAQTCCARLCSCMCAWVVCVSACVVFVTEESTGGGHGQTVVVGGSTSGPCQWFTRTLQRKAPYSATTHSSSITPPTTNHPPTANHHPQQSLCVCFRLVISHAHHHHHHNQHTTASRCSCLFVLGVHKKSLWQTKRAIRTVSALSSPPE